MATVLETIITWAAKHAPKGLILTDDPQGNANGAILNAYISKKELGITLESLSEAADSEKFRLNWSPGFEPKVPTKVDRRSKFDQCVDAGFLPNRAEGSTHASRQAEAESAARVAEVQRQRAAQAASQKQAEQRRLQYEEENIKIFKAGDRLDYGATEAAQKAAREKWSKIRGVTFVSDAIAAIPLESTPQDLMKFSGPQIKHWMKRRREAGLPI